MLIGGLAVAAHGHERATKDVDFITRLSLRDAKERLVAHGLPVEVRRGDPDEGVRTFLRRGARDELARLLDTPGK